MKWVFIALFASAMSVGTVVSWGPRREETDEGEVQRPSKTMRKFGLIFTVCGVFTVVLWSVIFVISWGNLGSRSSRIASACFVVVGGLILWLGWAYLNYYRVKWVCDGVDVFEDVDWRGRRRVVRHEDIAQWGKPPLSELVAVWDRDGRAITVNLKLFRAPNLIAAAQKYGTKRRVPIHMDIGF